MSMTDTDRSQPVHAPVAPDDAKNYQAAFIWGTIVNALKSGWNHVAFFTKSLRVGSGAATLAALDGSDGLVMSDGTAAGFYARDRADSTKYLGWYRSTSIRLYNGSSDLWTVDATSGLMTQPSLSSITAGTNVSLSVSAFGTTGSVQSLPSGIVYVQFNITATGAIAALAALGTTVSGHRPTSGTIGGFGATKFAGGVISAAAATTCNLFISTAGVINCSVALANTDVLIGTLTFLPK